MYVKTLEMGQNQGKGQNIRFNSNKLIFNSSEFECHRASTKKTLHPEILKDKLSLYFNAPEEKNTKRLVLYDMQCKWNSSG